MSDALPAGWMSAPLSALGKWLGGGTPSKAVPEYWTGGTIPWVSPKDMKRLVIDSAQDQITEAALRGSATNLVPARSVLMVTRSGILEHTFPVSVNAVPVTINQDLKAWTPSGVDSLYAAYYLRSRQQDVLRDCSKDGTTVSSIDFDQLAKFPMLVAPRAEQQRIVSRIEELFSEIDEGERALERVGRLVERYRQSVLKAAVTGELTRGWRASRAPTVDWDAQLQELRQGSWFAARKVAAAKAGDYPEPTRPKIGLDIELPASWALLSVEAATLAERPIAYGVLQPGPDSEDGVPMVRVCDVIDGQVQTGSLKRVAPEVVSQFPRTRLRGGEVLLTIVGTIGRTGIVPATLAGANVARAVAVLCAQPGVRAQWLELCLREERMRQLLTGNSREVARKTLNLEQLRECAIPVPSIDEQDEAISRARAMLSGADATATDLVRQAKAAEALRQSILKAAFSGQLVPQDPRDEPASALLARLAAQASDAPATPRRRGRPAGRRSSQPNPEAAG